MAKGRIVDDTTRLLIARVYRQHPEWRAKEVQVEVNKRLGQDWPGLSVVQKELTKIREHARIDNPEDKPWSVATLDQYPMSPEALAIVFTVWKFHVERDWSPLTIREAKWVSRLSGIKKPAGLTSADEEYLSIWARRYADIELLCEIVGRPFNTSFIDRLLMGLPIRLGTPSYFTPEEMKKLEAYMPRTHWVNGKMVKIFPESAKKHKGGTK
jgi:hypothetical protein